MNVLSASFFFVKPGSISNVYNIHRNHILHIVGALRSTINFEIMYILYGAPIQKVRTIQNS